MFLDIEIEKTYRAKTGTNVEKWFDVLLNLENQITKFPPPLLTSCYTCALIIMGGNGGWQHRLKTFKNLKKISTCNAGLSAWNMFDNYKTFMLNYQLPLKSENTFFHFWCKSNRLVVYFSKTATHQICLYTCSETSWPYNFHFKNILGIIFNATLNLSLSCVPYPENVKNDKKHENIDYNLQQPIS